LKRGPVVQGANKGGVWRAAPNVTNKNAVRAQRGRRGLISYGEVMPEKLSKSQRAQSKVNKKIPACEIELFKSFKI
jgi:hypothetical protein